MIVADVTALMINLNIPTKGCKIIQQMTDRICKNLKDRRENFCDKDIINSELYFNDMYIAEGVFISQKEVERS